jgi:hypothetical protein
MTLLSPTWLLALLPWAAFATWMLVGRRRRQRVPFLALWNAPEEVRRPKKGFEPPPLSLLFALLATLFATLALARPRAVFAGADARRLTIVIDRGASMSARGPTGQPRFAASAEALARSLMNRKERVRLELVEVPSGGGWRGSPDQLGPAVAALRRTAVDTADELRAAVGDLAAKSSDPLLVISDHDLGPPRPNVIPVTLPAAVDDAAITAVAERAGQVMVTVSTNRPSVRTLVIRSGDETARQEVRFTAPGRRNVFVDLSAAADVIEASLEGGDDFDADDRAWLVRGRPWPILEPRSTLTDELRRMIDVYRRLRPPGESSARVAIGRPGEVKSDEPAVVLAPVEGRESSRGEIRPVPHPVTAGVDWAGISEGAALATTGPPEGWTVVARVGDRPIVAVREGDTRQAWVGFESRAFARTPGFVVFWTNVFDHVAPGNPGFTAGVLHGAVTDGTRLLPQSPPPDAEPARWPGVFQTPTGKAALNTPEVTFHAGSQDWAARIATLPPSPSPGSELGPWLALASLACVALAAATWERRRGPAPKPPAHLDVETLHLVQTTFNADGHVHRHEAVRPPHDPAGDRPG